MGDRDQEQAGEIPFWLLLSEKGHKAPSVDMRQIVGTQDILFLCLDTLRYDAAVQEETEGNTPV